MPAVGVLGSVRPGLRAQLVIPALVRSEPGKWSRGVRIGGLRGLPPRRHLADERHALVELAHAVDEAMGRGVLCGGPCGIADPRGGITLARSPKELSEATVGLEVAPDHDAVVCLER